jgi:phospholipid/cholesterol/gamma-HCH transport system permease protein
MAAGLAAPLSSLGAFFLETAELVGGMGVMLGRIVARMVRLDLDPSELMRNLYKMGVKSLPIVVVTALFTGGIMVIQAAPSTSSRARRQRRRSG